MYYMWYCINVDVYVIVRTHFTVITCFNVARGQVNKGWVYIINSTTSDTDITSTDTSVTLDVPINHDSSTQYCVSVAAVDIVNRTGQHSDSTWFILDGRCISHMYIPLWVFSSSVPANLELDYKLFNGSKNNTANIGVSWSVSWL